MERAVTINNRALEEFLERLLRWGELCEQLRELYYKYLDLAAFRSEKCYFPGRRCVRSWKREYDVGDLTLMWTYILNTAPLCGKLMRTLTEIEYKIRLKALESLEKYGGVEKRNKLNNSYITHIHLKRPIYGYLVLLGDALYVIWGEFDGLPKDGRTRAAEIERRIVAVIEHYRSGKSVEMEVEEYPVDKEYERLWFEVPLPGSVAKLLGGMDKAPIALFRNLGWLLSDDSRFSLVHGSSNVGQFSIRLFDWLALATYAKSAKRSGPLVFRFTVFYTVKTKDGINPAINLSAIGTVAENIRSVYRRFGITLGKSEDTIAKGYMILRALREEGFKREGKVYVVDDVRAWIAFSATVATLILGDGAIEPFMLGISAKSPTSTAFKEGAVGASALARALKGAKAWGGARLPGWYMRLLLPAQPTPAFEKTVKLYDVLVNHPAIAMVEIDGAAYLLTYNGEGLFIAGKDSTVELYEAVRRFGVGARVKRGKLVVTYAQMIELAKHVPVALLNDLEAESFKALRPVPSLDLETLKKALEEVAKMAKFFFRRSRKYKRIVIKPYDNSKLWEIASMLKGAGIRVAVDNIRCEIIVTEQQSVEAVMKILTSFSQHRGQLGGRRCDFAPPTSVILYISFV